jgi:hypothetical protein
LEENGDIVYYHTPWKLAIFFTIWLAFGILMSVVMPIGGYRNWGVSGIIQAAACGIPFLLFALFTCGRILHIMRERTPAVIVSKRGLFDNSSILAGAGWVAWDEISSVHIGSMGYFSYLGITVKNDRLFVKKYPLLKRWLLWSGKSGKQGALVAITAITSSFSLADLEGIILGRIRP